jgi:predicted transcriptional regulator
MRHPQDDETGGAGRGRACGLVPQGRQLQVLSALWELGSATVARLQIELNSRFEPEIAYNTVLTYLRTLVRRRCVTVEPFGAGYLYSAAIKRDHARWMEIERITDLLFDGSREELLVALVNDRLTHPAALAHVREALEQRLSAERPASAAPAARSATPGPPSDRPAASSPGSLRPWQ